MQVPRARTTSPKGFALPQQDVLAWLIRLRWGACVAQLLAIGAVRWLFLIPLPSYAVFSLVGFSAFTNWLLQRRQHSHGPMSYDTMTWVIVADVAVVTGLLALTGGPTNPFANIYTVHIALAATTLPPAATMRVMAAAFAGFASLFVWYRPLAALQDVMLSPLYLQGFAAAFAAAIVFIAYFVGRIQQALAHSEARLAEARERAVRDEKLSSLATLAAGAAHELSTPLATIAIVAKEMERNLSLGRHDALREDALLIRQEVERCRDVLRHMAHDAGETNADSFVRIDPASLVQEALSAVQRGGKVAFDVDPLVTGDLYIPVRSVAHSLRAVVHNALEASAARAMARAAPGPGKLASPAPAAEEETKEPPAAAVTVRIAQVDQICYISVADDGCGMTSEVLARAGEPFFTTKGPGRGMGLGLFLARTVLERLGGGLRVDSRLGEGTTVVMQLPVAR